MEKTHSKIVEEYDRTLSELGNEPQEEPKSPVSIRVPPRYVFIADHFAAQIGETRSAFMEGLICGALEELMDYYDNHQQLHQAFVASKKVNIKEAA